MAHVIEACNSIYTFKVKYFFVVSSGWHTVRYPFIGAPSHTNQYYEAQSIEITVNGFTVSKDEIEVMSGGSDSRGSKTLELQTNELMQSPINNASLSFSGIAQEIINAYKTDRLIATFDLINNRKYEIDGETRYLRAGDRIKIKDLEGKYLSSSSETSNESVGNDFEIIKANYKYDGFYYREIVAKEILNSNS